MPGHARPASPSRHCRHRPPRTSIKGTIFRGHFERGGEPIAEGVAARVRQVLHFSELDVDGERSRQRELTYLCFGRPGRLHLAHEVTARPDFDHVLTARLLPETLKDQAGRPLPDDVAAIGFDLPQRVRFSGRDDASERRLAPEEMADGWFFQTTSETGSHGFVAGMEIQRELYLEVAALA